MIFVTVGAQLPFDRLCRAVDEWAVLRGRSDVFAQIGTTDWRPSAMRWVEMLPPDELRLRMSECDLVVGHAGMGTIISALELAKPIVVMPRRAALRETRNDHQVATARKFQERGALWAAMEPGDLGPLLDRSSTLRAPMRIAGRADEGLVEALRSFIWAGRTP